MSQLLNIPTEDIREPSEKMRPVDTESEEFISLRDSVNEKGILNPILVKPVKNDDGDVIHYEVIDGFHRFMCAVDLSLPEVPCQIRDDFDDSQILEAQLIANVHKVEARPSEYTKQLVKIMKLNPLITEAELAKRLGRSYEWLKQRLSLKKITDENIQALIDDGKIKLVNAYALAKLPENEQKNFVDRAMTEAPSTFLPQIDQRLKEIREARKKGEEAGESAFAPTPHMQTTKTVKDEYASWGNMPEVLGHPDTPANTAQDGWKAAIAWILHLDPANVEIQKSKHEEQSSMKEAQKAKRKAEQAKKRAEEAAKKAEEAAAEAAKIEETANA